MLQKQEELIIISVLEDNKRDYSGITGTNFVLENNKAWCSTAITYLQAQKTYKEALRYFVWKKRKRIFCEIQ